MFALLIVPVILSALLTAAHFLHHGNPLLTLACLAVLGLLLVPRRWAARTLQVLLLLAAAHWFWTMAQRLPQRMQEGPWLRYVAIMSVTSLFVALSALVFESKTLRRYYAN